MNSPGRSRLIQLEPLPFTSSTSSSSAVSLFTKSDLSSLSNSTVIPPDAANITTTTAFSSSQSNDIFFPSTTLSTSSSLSQGYLSSLSTSSSLFPRSRLPSLPTDLIHRSNNNNNHHNHHTTLSSSSVYPLKVLHMTSYDTTYVPSESDNVSLSSYLSSSPTANSRISNTSFLHNHSNTTSRIDERFDAPRLRALREKQYNKQHGIKGYNNSTATSVTSPSDGGTTNLASPVSSVASTNPSSITSNRVNHAKLARELFDDGLDKWLEIHANRPAWHFDRFQRLQLKQFFNTLDADGSGEIDIGELEGPLLSTGLVYNQSSLEELIKRIDKDKSGEIDYYEFLAAFKPAEARQRMNKDEAESLYRYKQQQLLRGKVVNSQTNGEDKETVSNAVFQDLLDLLTGKGNSSTTTTKTKTNNGGSPKIIQATDKTGPQGSNTHNRSKRSALHAANQTNLSLDFEEEQRLLAYKAQERQGLKADERFNQLRNQPVPTHIQKSIQITPKKMSTGKPVSGKLLNTKSKTIGKSLSETTVPALSLNIPATDLSNKVATVNEGHAETNRTLLTTDEGIVIPSDDFSVPVDAVENVPSENFVSNTEPVEDYPSLTIQKDDVTSEMNYSDTVHADTSSGQPYDPSVTTSITETNDVYPSCESTITFTQTLPSPTVNNPSSSSSSPSSFGRRKVLSKNSKLSPLPSPSKKIVPPIVATSVSPANGTATFTSSSSSISSNLHQSYLSIPMRVSQYRRKFLLQLLIYNREEYNQTKHRLQTQLQIARKQKNTVEINGLLDDIKRIDTDYSHKIERLNALVHVIEQEKHHVQEYLDRQHLSPSSSSSSSSSSQMINPSIHEMMTQDTVTNASLE